MYHDSPTTHAGNVAGLFALGWRLLAAAMTPELEGDDDDREPAADAAPESEEPGDCTSCDGTGIGQYGDSRCSDCRGSGVARDYAGEEDRRAAEADYLYDQQKDDR